MYDRIFNFERVIDLPGKRYKPPYTVTDKIVSLIAEICEALGRISILQEQRGLRLRRINRIKTVQGSLAIEGNTLSETQISAILDGKNVVAPPREVQEAHNAISVYDNLANWNPEVEAELLKAHEMLMAGLVVQPGKYRRKGAGVMGRNGEIMHMAPPADLVPAQMKDLFVWLGTTDAHPLVAGSVFHYEFEFIHPFDDGNGRIGRLWQTLILSQWNPLFAALPVESIVHVHQQEYYNALNQSTNQGNCTPFIEFMLETILETINADQVADQVTDQVRRLLKSFKKSAGKACSAKELMNILKLSHRPTFRQNYLHPALKAGLIEMTVPDKPNSRLQKYRLTSKLKM